MRLALKIGVLLSASGLMVLGACESETTDEDLQTSDESLGGGGSSGDADENGQGGAAPDPNAPPELLSQTGLFEPDGETLGPRVRAFTPRFTLWSDGASKRRWIYLPEGEVIDTTDPDYWLFPVGTKLWKEFTRDDVRVETRLMEKRPDGSWWRFAYQWNAGQTDAVRVPDGVQNASGTEHDIPSKDDCSTCHGNTRGTVLGFSAISLAHDGSELNLDALNEGGWLSEPVTVPAVPGDADTQAVLGYFHANCGTCHNEHSSVQTVVNMELRLTIAKLGSVEETPLYTTAVDQAATWPDGAGALLRIDAGSAATSEVFLRLNSRGADYSMPLLGTELIDETARDDIEAWINSL